MQATYRNLKSQPGWIAAIGIGWLGAALASGQQSISTTIPPADSPVYLLAGMRPIHPGDSSFELLPWNEALARAGVPEGEIAKLRGIEGLPFFGKARFELALKAIGVEGIYDTIMKYAISHPHPNPRLKPTHIYVESNSSSATSKTTTATTTIRTDVSLFRQPKPWDAFTKPPGTNMLPTVETNLFDGFGIEIPNTLPSTKYRPYNLHEVDPVVTEIDMTSPTDDLRDINYQLLEKSDLALDPPTREQAIDATSRLDSIRSLIQKAIDILEGNPVPDRAYSGFPLLHYNGPKKIKSVTPIRDNNGKTIGGNVDIHQVWFDSNIVSDTALLNAADVWDVPWTMTYTVDVLSRGHDDFSPFAIFTDDPKIDHNLKGDFAPPLSAVGKEPTQWLAQAPGLPHYGMDQSFYPMEDGTRTVFKIKMPPGKYFHLVYTWGWRMHPPRVQVTDRATKAFPDPDKQGELKTLVKWETDVFGEDPMGAGKEQAIGMIGDLSPAKRMWKSFQNAKEIANSPNPDYKAIKAQLNGDDADPGKADYAQRAYFDWRNRAIMRLPELSSDAQKIFGRKKLVDPGSDLTLLYVNNSIYGEFRNLGVTDYPDWTLRAVRDPTIRIAIYNADYFRHAYINIDFGGARGWENQFKSSVQSGGSGCWFTFGRANWWPNSMGILVDKDGKPIPDPNADPPNSAPKMSGLVTLPPAQRNPGYLESVRDNVQYVKIYYNYEPSRRLRFYQFDPTHHDVAVLSIH